MIDDLIKDATTRMDKSVEATHHELNTIRTGRASAALLDRVTVDYYGQETPLNQLATLNVPEPRMLTVQPFDPSSLGAIERAIQESDLGLNPSNDGKIIRLPIPQLTEERRQELVKVARHVAEEGRVAVRNVRRDVIHHLKEEQSVGADEEHRAEERVQKLTDEHVTRIDELLKRKEAEITEVVVCGHPRPACGAGPEVPREPGEIPRSVAIIMDGNSRWAAEQGLRVADGHREGTRALRRTVETAIDLGIESLTVYAFSTENWLRPPSEVDELMEIFAETIQRELPDLAEQGVRTRFVGRRDRVTPELRAQMADLEDETAHRDRLNLWIAFDYGGRAELAYAARRIVEEGLEAEEIDEQMLGRYLYAPELPDPDLLIRTSGELRISNFLLWQLAYSELVFTDRRWPEFSPDDLRAAVDEYSERQRRFGGR